VQKENSKCWKKMVYGKKKKRNVKFLEMSEFCFIEAECEENMWEESL
jgi:hypothetical protein